MALNSRSPIFRIKRAAKAAGLLAGAILVLSTGVALWGLAQTTVERPAQPPVVNDVTQLNPIPVAKIITPTTTEEIVQAVKSHQGPVSIGGGRYSMGGQTATEQALQIDMRQFNKILGFSKADKTITVQTGIRWRQIQEHIDPQDLSVKIMQTYSNFTVGGSLSVNVHGRYVDSGPLIHSVKALRVVLPDGTLVEASPGKHAEIFYGVIGGYGGLGVITEATLQLADNVRVERKAEKMPVARYRDYFFGSVRDSKSAVFHNADIYPDEYDKVHAVSYLKTDKPVTVPERLIPKDTSYRLDRFAFWVISEWPFGKDIREYVIDPLLYMGESVRWRNYEASYDVAELEPSSREKSTYVLHEYFVPVARLEEFVPKMGRVLRSHGVNVINVSIRHAHKDPGALLAWAREEVFAFVLYYKQGTDAESRRKVGVWTRELVDAVLSVGGTYYLPYQPHATEAQFLKAYPRAPEFFALKNKLDPQNRFRNKLWDKYYLPATGARKPLAPEAREKLHQRAGYLRDGGQTFLTHPEWFIVYSYDEFAAHLAKRLPSSFPYVASIGQYWTNYLEANRMAGDAYPANWGYQVMLWVIGVSYSVEYTLKGLYENTIGRVSEWLAGHEQVDEDRYAYRVAKEYADFTHLRPWYEFSFWSRLKGLWSETPLWGEGILRKWERKLVMSVELGVKSCYGWLIAAGSGAVYDPEADQMQMVVADWNAAAGAAGLKKLEQLDARHALVATPRYDAFRDAMLRLARGGTPVELEEIAGNREILLSGVAPRSWRYAGSRGAVEYALPLPSDASRKRVALRVPTTELIALLREALSGGLAVDHIYDY